jgi:hypothetical protein
MTATVEHADYQTDSPTGMGALGKRSRGVLARPNLKLFALGALCLSLVGSLLLDSVSASGRPTAWLDTSVEKPSLDALLDDARTYPYAELLFEIGRRYEQLKNYSKAMDYLRMANEAESLSDR